MKQSTLSLILLTSTAAWAAEHNYHLAGIGALDGQNRSTQDSQAISLPAEPVRIVADVIRQLKQTRALLEEKKEQVDAAMRANFEEQIRQINVTLAEMERSLGAEGAHVSRENAAAGTPLVPARTPPLPPPAPNSDSFKKLKKPAALAGKPDASTELARPGLTESQETSQASKKPLTPARNASGDLAAQAVRARGNLRKTPAKNEVQSAPVAQQDAPSPSLRSILSSSNGKNEKPAPLPNGSPQLSKREKPAQTPKKDKPQAQPEVAPSAPVNNGPVPVPPVKTGSAQPALVSQGNNEPAAGPAQGSSGSFINGKALTINCLAGVLGWLAHAYKDKVGAKQPLVRKKNIEEALEATSREQEKPVAPVA